MTESWKCEEYRIPPFRVYSFDINGRTTNLLSNGSMYSLIHERSDKLFDVDEVMLDPSSETPLTVNGDIERLRQITAAGLKAEGLPERLQVGLRLIREGLEREDSFVVEE